MRQAAAPGGVTAVAETSQEAPSPTQASSQRTTTDVVSSAGESVTWPDAWPDDLPMLKADVELVEATERGGAMLLSLRPGPGSPGEFDLVTERGYLAESLQMAGYVIKANVVAKSKGGDTVKITARGHRRLVAVSVTNAAPARASYSVTPLR